MGKMRHEVGFIFRGAHCAARAALHVTLSAAKGLATGEILRSAQNDGARVDVSTRRPSFGGRTLVLVQTKGPVEDPDCIVDTALLHDAGNPDLGGSDHLDIDAFFK